MRVRLTQFLMLSTAAALAGCASVDRTVPPSVSGAAPGAIAGSIQGTIHGGQQPVSGATVTVWLAGTTGYGAGATPLASTTTDANGGFGFSAGAYTCPASNAPVYLTAAGGNPGSGLNTNLVLAAGLGTCDSAHTAVVDVTEVTTIATAYALSHFFSTSLGGDPTTDLFGGPAPGNGVYNAGLALANNATIPMLVNLPNGAFNPSTSAVTLETAKLYSIANTLAACVNSTGQLSTSDTTTYCGRLFQWTTPPSGTRPADTLQAAVQMALYPYQNVTNLFNLAPPQSPFVGLSAAPNDWTVAASYTSSTFGLAINSDSSSNIDIDASGRVWFPTNALGAQGLAYFDPASQTFNGPYARGLGDPQYLAIDTQGTVWGSDLSANQLVGISAASPGAATTYTTAAGGVTGPLSVTPGGAGDGLLFSLNAGGTSTLYSESGGAFSAIGAYAGTPSGMATYTLGDPNVHEGDVATGGPATPCRLETQSTSSSYSRTVATSSGHPCGSGGIAQVDPSDGESVAAASSLNLLCSYNAGACFSPGVPLSAPQGIAVDGDSVVWIANAGNASVSALKYAFASATAADYIAFTPVAYQHGAGDGNTMSAPYGLAIDRSGNVWVSNASCVSTSSTSCIPSGFTLSELIGAAAPTATPLASSIVNVTVAQRPSAVSTPHAHAAQPGEGSGRGSSR